MRVLTVCLLSLVFVRSSANLLDQQSAAAIDSLFGDDSGASSSSVPSISNTGYPQSYYPTPSVYPVPYVPTITSGSSWPYYSSPSDNNNWNYGMPVPSFIPPYVNNGNCYYFFNTAMVYDMSTFGERIATQWEQNNMSRCLINPYYVPCLCLSCST